MRLFVVALLLAAVAGRAEAQAVDRRYVEEPTDGVALPAAPRAGEFDGRVVATNPGGLSLVRGSELALALELEDPDVATSAGQGFGGYLAYAGGGGILPRFGVGLGLEWLRPARSNLAPDPGEPFRATLGLATVLGASTGLGVSWHHFRGGSAAGRDTFDVGMTTRFGNHFAAGAVLRDLATSSIAGQPIQRRYELELLARPLATDRLELALGGRYGETRHDLDGWAWLSARIARGTFVHAALESRAVRALVDSPAGLREDEGRDARATLGLELSFGDTGVIASATGLRDDTGANHALGGQLVLRFGSVGPASVLGRADHIERLQLEGSIGVRETTALVTRMRAIARDRSAKAVVITFDGVSAGWATLQELRDEIRALRAAGKKTFAYMVSGTGRDYFVATAADKIYVDPAGGLRLVGMAGTTIYYKGAFDLVGIVPQFTKIAEYKSAPEQYTETGPSPESARMMTELFDSMWDQWLAQVADARGLSRDELRALIDRGPFTAGDLAGTTKLVDAVAAPDKVSELVAKELGGLPRIGGPPADRPERWQRPRIAVIYVDGDISDGASRAVPFLGQKLAGSETLVGALTAARADPSVRAIVLRIDSPGGSAVASELIAREIFATRGVKPIVCSMGDVAASGGYFVAAGCDLVFAEPMTITGSIGIFYGKFDVSGLIHRLGVATVTQKRGARADVESMFRPYTDDERAMMLEKLRYMYGRFVGAVAEGRKMKKEEVDAVGRGHVWTGAQARPIRLVDRFGGIADAIDEAKRRAGLAPDTRVQLVELPRVSGGLLGLVRGLVGVRAEPGLFELPLVRDLVRGLPASLLVAPATPQARLILEPSWE